MRVALTLTLLVGILLVWAAWKDGSDLEQGWQPFEGQELSGGWSHLVMGQPSGAEPLNVQPVHRSATASSPGSSPGPSPTPRPEPLVEPADDGGFTYWVQSGDTLTQICSRYYTDRRGRSLTELARIVAQHNGLESPDSIRAGNILVMPSLPEDDTP